MKMTEEYLLIAEWFDEETGEWKPVISKKPVIKRHDIQDK